MELTQIVGTDLKTARPVEEIEANVVKNMASQGLPMVSQHSKWREYQKVAVVGGGPSLKDTIGGLNEYNTIIVAGSAHDYFMATYPIFPYQDVYCIICDPDPVMATYLRNHGPNVTYLIASCCHEDVYRMLKGRRCYIWHSVGTGSTQELIDDENAITGGCTIGTRAIVAAMYMGYKDIHLYGFDTCLTQSYKHHAYDFNTEWETLGNIIEIKLGGDDSPTFIMAAYMVAQLFDFQNILKLFGNRLMVTVHGGGALAYILELGKKQARALLKKEDK